MKYYKGSLGAVTCPCFFHEITGIKSLVQFLAQKVLSEDLEPMMTIPSPLVLLFALNGLNRQAVGGTKTMTSNEVREAIN